MEILITAFLLGLMGSFHCVGMCGPIALSLPLRGESIAQKIIGGVLWSLGRITTYGFIGALFGLIGTGLQLLGFQQVISILMGSLMIISVIIPSLFKKGTFGILNGLFNPVRRGLQDLFRKKNNGVLLLIGILNGLLPCGLVYYAVAGAIGTAGFISAVSFMILFGLGTVPMLLMIALLGNFISVNLRSQLTKMVPVVVIIIGLIFILRGLSLGIPYLSPPKEKLNPSYHQKKTSVEQPDTIVHSCCEKKN